MTTPQEGIADKVRGVAAERRFSQGQIAETLKLSRTSIAERMNARVAWTAPELFTLAKVMGVPITRFFPEVPAMVTA
jgi:transcriptional regulator with XRE-family HTH domain